MIAIPTRPQEIRRMWNKSFQIHDIVTDHRTGRRYRIERFLNQGAYSEVWLARCLDTGVDYAIKSLKLKHTSDPKTLERNEREGDALFLLNHPNVVRVHCMGKRDEDGLIFMVMDLLVGGSLRQRLQSFGGKLPIPWALEIMVSVCDGLEAIHELAIHRDLKPENLHVGEDGRVCLYDLGAAKYPKKSRLTTGGFTIGTVEYMSPEQLGAPATLDARSDLYSVGVMLYESLTGVHPHATLDPLTGKYLLPDDALALGRRIMYQPHRPLREAAPNLEDYIVQTAERLLCKFPKDRIRSAAGAADLLAGCLARFLSEHAEPSPLPLSDIGKLAAADAADASDAEDQEPPWPTSTNPFITISQPPSPPARGAGTTKLLRPAAAFVSARRALPFATTDHLPTARLAIDEDDVTHDSGQRMTWLPGDELPNDPILLAKEKEDEPDAEPRAISGERWIDVEPDDDDRATIERLRTQSRDAEDARREAISLEPPPLSTPPPSPAPPRPRTPSEQAALQHRGEVLRRMMARIPEPLRIAFFLAKIEEKSLEEISARTGVQEDIVVERVLEASQLILAMLNEEKQEKERAAPAPHPRPVAALQSREPPPPAHLTLKDRLSTRWASLPERTRAVVTVFVTVILVVYWGLTAVYILRNYGKPAPLAPVPALPASAK